jgi:hypothetical protein
MGMKCIVFGVGTNSSEIIEMYLRLDGVNNIKNGGKVLPLSIT